MKALLAALTVCVLGVLAASASGHQDGCHVAHSCPSDHHTYVWYDDQGRGNDCAKAGDPDVGADDKVRVVYDGLTYFCHFVGAYALPGATPSPSPGPVATVTATPVPAPAVKVLTAARALAKTKAALEKRYGAANRRRIACSGVRGRKYKCAFTLHLGSFTRRSRHWVAGTVTLKQAATGRVTVKIRGAKALRRPVEFRDRIDTLLSHLRVDR